MTWSALLAYAAALAVLAATPGPVIAAIIARAATGGVRAIIPLALGVAIGDVIWPILAFVGVQTIGGIWGDALVLLRYFGAAMLTFMGLRLILGAGHAARTALQGNTTRQRGWAAFVTGLAVIAGNPKAILFYIGVLPGFFELTAMHWWEMAVVCMISALVPFVGNLCWAALFAGARRFLSDEKAMRMTYLSAGIALILVGVVIAMS